MEQGTSFAAENESPHAEAELLPISPAPLFISRRHLWAQKLTSLLEEYCALLLMPVLCIFAVYSLTKDSYATQKFVLSTNSSILLEPNPFLVNTLQVQAVDGKSGPVIYGFVSSPKLGHNTSWIETHHLMVAADQFEATEISSFWLNKGSVLNVTCSIKDERDGNAVVWLLEESRSTGDWVEDPDRTCEWLCSQANDNVFHYHVLRDGHYLLSVENTVSGTLQMHFTVEVLATLYDTDNAVYLCIPSTQPCQLPISLYGIRAAVLSTLQYSESDSWKAQVSFKVRWFMLFAALGGAALVVATNIRLLVYLRSRITIFTRHQHSDTECDWGDYGQIEEANTSDAVFCKVCLDAQRNSFFTPCGHSVTCFPCGSRVKMEEQICPACNTPIESVNQVFHV